nr:phospholipase-like protein [Tanacetum cinerariifolium]GFA26986.1 phospholipase-like protein [Tanacetum cinerariifolium]
MFGKLFDDDAIRLCLLLALEDLKERHGDEHYYGLFKDRNYVPTNTLFGFVFAFQIWILETFERCESWWIKDTKVIPRALGWSKKSLFTRSDYSYLFSKVLAHERSDRQAKLKFTDEFSNMTSDLCDSLNKMFADLIEAADYDEDIA